MTDIKVDNGAPVRIICGSGRSGTTWVQDCLAEANGLRPVFEPLHQTVTPLGEQYAYRSLQRDEEHPRLEQYLRRVHAGDYYSLWTDYRARKDQMFPPLSSLRRVDAMKRWLKKWRKYLATRGRFRRHAERPVTLLKFIRANLMIGWLKERFDARIVLLIRHPAAVIESQLRLGEMWNPAWLISRYRKDEALCQLLGEPYVRLLKENLSRAGQLTLCWCIENVSLPARASELGYEVVYYEQLRYGGAKAWQKLTTALDLADCPQQEEIGRPSQKAARNNSAALESLESPYWLKRLDDSALREVERVLGALQCSLYQLDRAQPIVGNPAGSRVMMV